MANKNVSWEVAAIFVFLLAFALSLTLGSYNVDGATNDTIFAKVNVTNTEPTLYSVVVDPGSIDLTPGNTTKVNCTGEIYDINGWDDIIIVNATLYDSTYGDGITFDNNYRYVNATCNSSCTSLSTTNASCTCTFNVEYYANNGTWQCNMTAADSGGLVSTRNSTLYNINTVIGIDVPAEIDFGNLSVTETSSQIVANVTNLGNVPINISLRAFGGTNESEIDAGNYSMICAYGNITTGYQRYSINSSVAYSAMDNVTNTSTEVQVFKVPVRTDDNNYGNTTNATYWRLQIPSEISGFCNGTIVYTASETTY